MNFPTELVDDPNEYVPSRARMAIKITVYMTAENPKIEVNAKAARSRSRHMGKRNVPARISMLLDLLFTELGTPIIWNNAVKMSPSIPK